MSFFIHFNASMERLYLETLLSYVVRKSNTASNEMYLSCRIKRFYFLVSERLYAL